MFVVSFVIDIAHMLISVVFLLCWCVYCTGERSHLRDKQNVHSNGQDYLWDLFWSSSRVAAKLAISVDDGGEHAMRVGASVKTALKYDPVYRRVLGFDEKPLAVAMATAYLNQRKASGIGAADSPEVCRLVPRAADEPSEIIDPRLRGELAVVANVFSMPHVTHVLSSTAPLMLVDVLSVSNARFPPKVCLEVGQNVSFRWRPVRDRLSNPADNLDPVIARVVRIFKFANTVWLKLTPYADVVDGAAQAANWREVELQPLSHCLVPICAIERHVLLEHKHALPSGVGAIFNPSVHCRFALSKHGADTNPRRILQCLQTNHRYVLNEAVSEKNAVVKSV